MTLREMRARVQEELSHIPDWPREHQSDLRMIYWARRMQSLGKKASGELSAGEVLLASLEQVQALFPGVRFTYVGAFFGLPEVA